MLVTIVTILLIPDASPLIGMLMLGNFLRECKVTERLVQASQNEIINIVTIFLGTSVGLTMQGDRFLQKETLLIILLGIVAFGVATAGGVIAAKLMNLIWRKNPVNPLIGSAGVSAVRWRPASPTMWARSTIPPTTFSCTPWDRTLRA